MKTIWFDAKKLGYRLYFGERYTGPAIEVDKDTADYLKTLTLSSLVNSLYIIGIKKNNVKIICVEMGRYYQYNWHHYDNEYTDQVSKSNEVFFILKDIASKYGIKHENNMV